jgi:23S rRNA pseudouridine2457 synthase
MQHQYILFFKPFGVLSQFTPEGKWKSLKEFGPFPLSVYPVGRLDAESEGLLLLTDDNRVKQHLTDPIHHFPKTYIVQVEGIPDEGALQQLRTGVIVEGRLTEKAGVMRLDSEPLLPPRPVPIRFRKNIPTSWIEMTLHEGRNRQIRKMTAAIGFPALRILRSRIGFLTADGLEPGQHRFLSENEIAELRKAIPPRLR